MVGKEGVDRTRGYLMKTLTGIVRILDFIPSLIKSPGGRGLGRGSHS